MLRVTVEIVPYGDESRARSIATLTIANVGPDVPDGTPCDYEVRGVRCLSHIPFVEDETVFVRGFVRGRNATALVGAAVDALVWGL